MRLAPRSLAFTALIAALSGLVAMSIDISLPALPALVREFGRGEALAAQSLGLFLAGFGVGQLVSGPLSDRFGRRPVLLGGLGCFAATALGCTLAPSLEALVALRLVQGLCASASVTSARAVVRDLFEGQEAAAKLSQVTMVVAIAPMLAPILGGALQEALGWRAVYGFLAVVGVVLAACVFFGLDETLARRNPLALRPLTLARNYWRFLRTPQSMRGALANACFFGGMFAYIASAPFVFIDLYGVPRTRFGLLFALTALGLMAGGFTNTRLLRRHAGARIMRRAAVFAVIAAGVLLADGMLGFGGVAGLMVPLVAYTYCLGMIMSNGVAAAMQPHPDMAGVAAAGVGATQMLGGFAASAVVGALYAGTPMAMAATVAACAVLGAAALSLTPRPSA